jgi:anti-sigma factor RsiW
MSDHVIDRLSAYLDDDLDARDRAAVDAHLRACPPCAAELDGIRTLVERAGAIPSYDAAPAGDLWSGIKARIEAPAASAATNVASFADAATRRGTIERRVSLSFMQLAAAAVLLIAVSGSIAWIVRGRTPDATSAGVAGQGSRVIQAEVEPQTALGDVRPVNLADAQYDAAVSDLERALGERRNDLNPRTVEILERNLRLIDAAITQARQALEEDPANTYLNRHLVESRRRKLDLLRRATAITEGD